MMDDDMIATAVPRKTSANTNTNRTLHYISDEAMEERREEIGLFVTTQKKADRIFLVYTPHSLRWRNRAIPTRGHVKGHLNSMILVLNFALLPYASRRKRDSPDILHYPPRRTTTVYSSTMLPRSDT